MRYRHMAMVIGIVLGLATYVTTQTGEPDTIVIVGATHPEQIPQWFIWQETFRSIHRRPAPRPGEPGLGELIPLASEELARVRHEASEAARDEAQLGERLKTRVDAWRAEGKPLTQVISASQLLEVEHRRRILERAERLMARLSEDGRRILRGWIDHAVIEGTVIRVPARSLADFRVPK